MLQKEGGLVGERLLDQRRVIDLEMVGVVVTWQRRAVPGARPAQRSGIDQVLPVADAHQ